MTVPPAISSEKTLILRYELPGSADPAEQQIARSCQGYLIDLVDRVRSEEEGDRVKGLLEPEVTASAVIRADAHLRDKTSRTKPSRTYTLAQFAAPISGGLAGILAGPAFGQQGSAILGAAFGVALLLSIVSTAWTVWGRQ